MRFIGTTFFSLIFLFSSFAQKIEISESDLQMQLDSILKEAHLLYSYEKSAWIATDLARENKDLRSRFGGFFTYENKDQIIVVILDKRYEKCVAEYRFKERFDKPKSEIIKTRKLNKKEKTLFKARDKLLENLMDEKYNIGIAEGFGLNPIFIPFHKKYKLYIITGTSLNNVIPFGNDYIFISDKNGNVEFWHKFHSRLIAEPVEYEGNKVTKMTHSHLATTPLITPTDICTFMLYAPIYDIDEFSVYSPAIGAYMTYNWKSDKISVKWNSKE